MVKLISSGSPFEKQMAYSRAVVDGEWIFVSGTTGFDYATMQISDEVANAVRHASSAISCAIVRATS